MYTTLLMSTGLTFGSISALFGLTNHSIDEVDKENAQANHRLAPVIEAARAQARADGVAFEVHLLPGQPVHTIVVLADEEHFELLVVGFMGHTRLYEQIIGSTTERLVRLAPCAVLVVK